MRIPGYLWMPRFAATQAGLAGAQDTLNFLQDFSITHQTGLVPRYYQDGLAYFGQSVEALPQTATVTLHVEATALAVSEFYDKWAAQTVDFMQLKATGPIIAAGRPLLGAAAVRAAVHRRAPHRLDGQRREPLRGQRRDGHRRLMGDELQRRHRLHAGRDRLAAMPGLGPKQPAPANPCLEGT